MIIGLEFEWEWFDSVIMWTYPTLTNPFFLHSPSFYYFVSSLQSDEEEPVCPYPGITEKCQTKCTTTFAAYEACAVRIKTKPGHDCEQWFYDHMKCVDKCRVPQIFKLLK